MAGSNAQPFITTASGSVQIPGDDSPRYGQEVSSRPYLVGIGVDGPGREPPSSSQEPRREPTRAPPSQNDRQPLVQQNGHPPGQNGRYHLSAVLCIV